MSDRDREEEVDGARIAAQIINRLSPDNKKRVVKRIAKEAPATMDKIQKDLVNIADIVDLTPQGLQYLIAQLDYNDLLAVIANTNQDVAKALLGNMTQRKRIQIRNDIQYSEPLTDVEFQSVEKRVLRQLDTLRTQGTVRLKADTDTYV